MAKRLEEKVAIVTGAGSIAEGIGNGKATAIVFAREGARVMLIDLNPDAAEETRAVIESEGGECIVFQADVSSAKDCEAIVDQCLRSFGQVDILHNNVGIEEAGGLESTSETSWDRTLNVNLKSMFLMCKQVIGPMKKQGSGAIVNISSINAIRTLPALSLAYGVSKAGVISLTREIAVEFAGVGIRANAILPGMMNTPFVTASLTEAYGGDVSAMTEKRDAFCPTGRQGEGWDVANLALFLASEEAKYITGASIVVDGAQTCRI
jgi:NAD(P)-dependent dehydrogenase (short-subunit alcohol dehydrogenase family)